jgi:hypothetical protein
MRHAIGRVFVSAVLVLIATFLVTGCPQAAPLGDADGDDSDATPSAKQRQDLWTTNTESSSVQDFSASPLPAGFFDFDGRQCDAFAGAASFVGTALSQNTSGAADTIVTREGDPIAPSADVGATGTVAVRITGLNLHATAPIEVLCDGTPTQWNVLATLSDAGSPAGTLTAVKTHENGGTAETVLPVLLKLTFTSAENPAVQRALDFAEEGLPAVEFHAQMTWVHRIDPNDPDAEAGFLVGVAGGPEAAKLVANGKAGPRLQGGATLIACSEHGNPGGDHLHNTCTADTDSDGIPDGADKCRFAFDPDQADRDGDLFGDACDACPDDPDCPQEGDECDELCQDVNDELLAAWEELAPKYCEMFACLCIPPACDPEAFEMSPECEQVLDEISATADEFSCLYTRFSGWGCDRCALPSLEPPDCPDPCDTAVCPEGQTCQQFIGCYPDFDFCAFVTCPEGQGCDPQNGQCCANPSGGCPLPPYDACEFVTCPADFVCNPATGQCWNPDSGECTEQDVDVDACEHVTCADDEFCDPSSGVCVSLSDPCAEVTCGEFEFCDFFTGECVSVCDFITCLEGQTCNPETTACE